MKGSGISRNLRRYQLVLACLVIAVCFVLGNDMYRAKAIVLKNKDLFAGNKKVVNYMEAVKAKTFNKLVHSDLSRQYLIDPKRAKQKSLLRMFAGGDTCGAPATTIAALPYTDAAGTTVGLTDNYDLPPDTTFPTLTGCPTCTETGGGSAGSLPTGAVYTGTGTGPDSAYKITFNTGNANILVNMDPTAQDMAVMVYTNVCSSSLADGIVIDDSGVAGAAESVQITTMPAGTYHIVVDGYSTGGTPPGPSDTYTLNVTCVTGQTCIQPAPATAAGVGVNGRVLTSSDGRGLVGARVTLTDQAGVVRSTITVKGGRYTFDDLEPGQTYIVSVSSRRFNFQPQVIQVTDNIAELNFVPE
ncbi:MAG: carboxypeptidase regulatory-like domain-containing protein [Chloracidobacterium sp.]|nr:carboxypeptidase regulatory-like domain-containing protein [Chloracidobacterium sp.]